MSAGKNLLMIMPNLRFGGAELSFANLSRELSQFYNVYIVIFSIHSEVDYTFGGEIINLEIEAGKNLLDKTAKFRERIRRVKAIKKRLNIDLSISFLEGADYVNILSRVNDKVVVSIRGSKSHDENIAGAMGLLRKRVLIPWLYNKADYIVTLNNGIALELRHDFGINSRVPVKTIYNFYDVQKHETLAAEPIEADLEEVFSNPVLITHGRLAPEKGLQHLIPVFAELNKKLPETRLVIIGDGPVKNQLYQLCDDHALPFFSWEKPFGQLAEARVLFLGYKANPFKYLRQATLFCLTSSAEGFGNSIAEAMICGLPVVSTDCPSGPREILAPGSISDESLTEAEFAEYGILMPLLNKSRNPNSITTWVSVLYTLLGNNTLLRQYSARSQDRVRDFTREKVTTEWLRIIDELVQ